MASVRIVHDFDECAELWHRVMPRSTLSDLWEIRLCFHQHFKRPLHFLTCETDNRINGLLPLSWIEENGCYGYFPGETWQGKTWLEQNRLMWNGGTEAEMFLRGFLSPYNLRYLQMFGQTGAGNVAVDEVGYLFLPSRYDYDLENYYREFSHKSLKRIRKELTVLEAQGITYRYNTFSDFDLMVELNLQRFGDYSYFCDHRFRRSFESLAQLLREREWLRLTTVLIGGEPAAVDMGCVYDNVYTVLAGGTNGRFSGVAKLINLHHLKRACAERYEEVDFLCGDFHWKTMFHLTPRPLYLLSNLVPQVEALSAAEICIPETTHAA